MINYTHQSQLDYPDTKITRQSVAKVGCFLTALAMKFSGETGTTITPADIDEWMDAHAGYHGDSLDHGAIVECAKHFGLKFTRMVSEPVGADPKPGQIMKVKTSRNTDHFILCVGQNDKGRGLYLDPGSQYPTHYTLAQRKYTPLEWRLLV